MLQIFLMLSARLFMLGRERIWWTFVTPVFLVVLMLRRHHGQGPRV